MRNDGIRTFRQHWAGGLAARARLYELGDPKRGAHPWTLDEESSRPLIRQAVEAGINFFDTANVYSDGSSEEIVGRPLKDFGRRDELVIATKVHGRMHDGLNGAGLSRKAIMAEVDASLARLGTDYIDLYQIHRWDPLSPIEETLEALHDVVKAGKARYIGASSMNAWQFSKAHYLARMADLTPFVSMQNHYNLLNREEERRCCRCAPIWGSASSPGVPRPRKTTRDWDEETTRSQTDEFGSNLYRPGDRVIVEEVARIASSGRSPEHRSRSPGWQPARHHRADHRRHQASPHQRRSLRPRPRPDRRRAAAAGDRVRTTSPGRLLTGPTT